MKVDLVRTTYTEKGTFGVLLIDNLPVVVTLEPPWKDNQQNISCIPTGEYMVQRCNTSEQYDYKDSPTYGNTFVIEDVPNRSKVLFHWGNTMKNTDGCILTGTSFGVLNGKPAIISSKLAFKGLMRRLSPVDLFQLRIATDARVD